MDTQPVSSPDAAANSKAAFNAKATAAIANRPGLNMSLRNAGEKPSQRGKATRPLRPHVPKEFSHLGECCGLTRRTIVEHIQLYENYIHKYNQLSERLRVAQDWREPSAMADFCSLKVDIIFLLGAIKNHEVYFEVLGCAPQEPPAALVEAVEQSFSSFDKFVSDLKHSALDSRGWAWTAWDFTAGRLFNFIGSAHHAFPVWDAVPILAIDLFEHAYFYDYGWRKTDYIEAVVANMNWAAVAKRYAALTSHPSMREAV